MTDLGELIDAQAQLQRDMGYDIELMTQAERISYIHTQATNVIGEVMEALGEVDWKPWAKGQDIREDACFGELRDAWQCLTNMMLAVKVGDGPADVAAQLGEAIAEKHVINRRRITSGYDGRTNKCPRCRRAYDDVAVTCHPRGGAEYAYCAVEDSHFVPSTI